VTHLATTNSALVRQFLDHALAGRTDAALELVDRNHVEHSLTIPAGRDGVAEFLNGVAANRDQMRVTVHRMIADEQHVVVQLETDWAHDNRRTMAVDIFRLEDGRIVEHWDVVQPLPAQPTA
jgi:predicted SnoaL-like aldol condensation-catalyzing enzyme